MLLVVDLEWKCPEVEISDLAREQNFDKKPQLVLKVGDSSLSFDCTHELKYVNDESIPILRSREQLVLSAQRIRALVGFEASDRSSPIGVAGWIQIRKAD